VEEGAFYALIIPTSSELSAPEVNNFMSNHVIPKLQKAGYIIGVGGGSTESNLLYEISWEHAK